MVLPDKHSWNFSMQFPLKESCFPVFFLEFFQLNSYAQIYYE